MTSVAGLSVARPLRDFIETEALPGTGVSPERFWSAYAAILQDLAPKNAALLKTRDDLQARIDAWHRAHPARPMRTDGAQAASRSAPPSSPAPRAPGTARSPPAPARRHR